MLILGKYELLEGETEGGLSRVLAGRSVVDGTHVAIKIVNGTGKESDRAIANDLYELELRNLKKLRGVPNVIQLLDHGFDASLNENVLVLEWLEISLSERLSQVNDIVPAKDWVNFSQTLMRSVSRAHSRSIAHRDIKPGNIMFRTNSPNDWDCVLIDFGTSKYEGTDFEDANQTMREYRTPAYASSHYLEEDAYSRDIYGIAAVMVRLRLNREFTSSFSVQDALAELVSQQEISQFVPILKKALESQSIKRFKTIKDFHGELISLGNPEAASRNAKRFLLVLTNEAKEQLRELQAETSSREYANLENLLSKQVYLRLPKDSNPQETSNRFNLHAGFLDLKCKGPDSDSRNPHIISVRNIIEIEQSEMEFKVSHSKPVPIDRFRFILDGDLRKTPVGQLCSYKDFASLVANPNKAKELKLDERIAHKVAKWEAILEAKEEFILGSGSKTKFRLIDSQFRSLTLMPVEIEGAEFSVPSTWGLEGSAGLELLLDYQDSDGSLAFTANRDVTNFPRQGTIYPTLGENAPSFRRQKQALENIREHGDDLGNWVQVIVDPSKAQTQPLLHPLEVFDEKLDEAKIAALEVALQAQDVAVVQGPPGTGKTSFIVELVKQFTSEESGTNKILLVSQTHIAVDNALERLHKSGHASLLRVGRDEKVSPETRQFLINNRLGSWQANVENSSSAFLRVLVSNLGCDSKAISVLGVLNRLLELRGRAAETDVIDFDHNQTTFAKQVDQVFEDAGIQEPENVELDFEALGKEEKDLVYQLQEAGYSRQEALTWKTEDIFILMQQLLDSGPHMRKAWALAQAQSKWIRLFKSDERLKKTFVGRTQVIAGTCIGFLSDQYARDMEFDLCIIDEASKATATEILVPMSRSKKTILVGDTNQLPPTEEQMTRDSDLMAKYELTAEDVEVTLFETLATELPETSQRMLTRQYRMLPVIGEMISKVFYKGRVESEPKLVPDWVANSWGEPLQFLDTSLIEANHHDEVGTSVRNRAEASIAVQHVAQLLAKLSFEKNQPPELRIVMLAPYAAQVTELRHVLSKNKIAPSQVEVMTFDSAQGIECDFAIVTATRSSDATKLRRSDTGRFGFISKSKWKRINVGLSRARFGLAIVGNRSFLRDGSGFADVIEYMEKTGADIRIAQVTGGAPRNG